jgi:hypothetical protein
MPTFESVDHDPFADDTGYYRSPLWPTCYNEATGENEVAWPGFITEPLRAMQRAQTAIRAGQQPSIGDALQISSLAMLPGGSAVRATKTAARASPVVLEAAAESPEIMASRLKTIYNPPSKPPRPFEADYPAGAPTDATGRLLFDIDGRPLVAETVVGRTMAGAPDEALTPEGAFSLGEATTGKQPEAVATRAIGGDAARLVTTTDRRSGAVDRQIYFDRGLDPTYAPRAVAHEVGHAIDQIAGKIPTEGLVRDLDRIYNTLNTGQERTRNLTRPQNFGYSPEAAPRELLAEAIRAYLTDPNYLKTVSPDVAARIRAAVNTHPTLSRTIQFNAGGLGLAGAGPMFEPVDHDPFDAGNP